MSSCVQEFLSFSAKKKTVFAAVFYKWAPLVTGTALRVLPVMRSVEKVESECKTTCWSCSVSISCVWGSEQQKMAENMFLEMSFQKRSHSHEPSCRFWSFCMFKCPVEENQAWNRPWIPTFAPFKQIFALKILIFLRHFQARVPVRI